jgi:hypothetical protein
VLTIVMYHYVRDGARVHARTTAEFERQLDFVEERYTVVGCEAVRERRLPENACLLTFDDGLREHLDTVAPALEARAAGRTRRRQTAGTPAGERGQHDVIERRPQHRGCQRRAHSLRRTARTFPRIATSSG